MSETTPESVELADAVAVAAVGRRRSRTRPSIRGIGRTLREAIAGVVAVGVKELRGRMRGRRAFVILTAYLVLLGGFAWMMELILEQRYSTTLAGTAAYASASIGRGIFIALLLLETLLVVALAPAFTAGAISLEREKQTLDLLATTPISSIAIVIGKLFSALTYLFILIFASIPLNAMVFVFGGVAPDDVIRGYLVLFATAIGLGSLGLFFSALVRRTQAATIVTYFGVMAVTLGAFFIFFFWNAMTSAGGAFTTGFGPIKGRPPEALVFLNPYFAQADIICGVETAFSTWCDQIGFVTNKPTFGGFPITGIEPGIDPAFREPTAFPDVASGFNVTRDTFWPKSAISWLVLSAILLIASVQLVTPTRRLRPRLPGFLRRSTRRAPAS